MGRKRRDTPTRELVRFSLLIRQLIESGLEQTGIADSTGITKSHLNQILNYGRYSRTSVGAESIRLMRDGLRISPDFFFDDWPDGDRNFRVYLLSEKRAEKRMDAFEARLVSLERNEVELRSQLLNERAEKDVLRAENEQLRKRLRLPRN